MWVLISILTPTFYLFYCKRFETLFDIYISWRTWRIICAWAIQGAQIVLSRSVNIKPWDATSSEITWGSFHPIKQLHIILNLLLQARLVSRGCASFSLPLSAIREAMTGEAGTIRPTPFPTIHTQTTFCLLMLVRSVKKQICLSLFRGNHLITKQWPIFLMRY